MRPLQLKILYFAWKYFASRQKFPKLCEKINLIINKLENKK